uniref:Uncharacterized protein n=1 Tax=Amphilophus citrinellus TaxID=61819 RepID=A0A3Q0QTL4_AMPCI
MTEKMQKTEKSNSYESLKFAQEFKFEDDDILVVTYPKSGQCFCQRLKEFFYLTES